MATNDELLQQWAQQNGADYDLLKSAQNGNTQTTPTTTNTNTNNNDIYSEYGWDSNTLPGTNIPTTGTTTTTPTTTTTGTTTTGGTSTTSGGTSVQDYINYYTSRGQTTPDKDYDTWVAWMQSGGDQQPTTPTTPTNPTNPSTPTTTPTTQGTSVEDYVNYYKNLGMTTPDKDYETWVAWIQSGGDTQNPTNPSNPSNPANPSNPSNPSNSTTTQGTSVQDYINYWVSRGVTTPPMDYNTWVTYITNGGDPSNPSGTPGSNTPGSNVTHNYPAVDMDNRQRINDMYDAQINAQRAALQEQGDQALSDAQANRDKIAGLYNKQRNAASVDWERQRRNFLEGANTSGLNTGAGSQAELSMMSMYQRAQNDLGAAQAQAEADADRNIADIKRSTQASINEAIAKNDYQKAAALLDEYNAEYNRAVERAEALAQYGDFSGYAALYGDEAAAQMRYTWIMSNPEIALAMGLISQSQYAALTLYKQYPALALAGSSSGSGSDGGGYNPATGLADVFNNHSDEIIQGIINREMSVISGATNNG